MSPSASLLPCAYLRPPKIDSHDLHDELHGGRVLDSDRVEQGPEVVMVMEIEGSDTVSESFADWINVTLG